MLLRTLEQLMRRGASGKVSPFEFDWFRKKFPREQLLVINAARFNSDAIRGVTLEDFLLDESL
jgi:hypothetical protein